MPVLGRIFRLWPENRIDHPNSGQHERSFRVRRTRPEGVSVLDHLEALGPRHPEFSVYTSAIEPHEPLDTKSILGVCRDCAQARPEGIGRQTRKLNQTLAKPGYRVILQWLNLIDDEQPLGFEPGEKYTLYAGVVTKYTGGEVSRREAVEAMQARLARNATRREWAAEETRRAIAYETDEFCHAVIKPMELKVRRCLFAWWAARHGSSVFDVLNVLKEIALHAKEASDFKWRYPNCWQRFNADYMVVHDKMLELHRQAQIEVAKFLDRVQGAATFAPHDAPERIYTAQVVPEDEVEEVCEWVDGDSEVDDVDDDATEAWLSDDDE